MKGINDINLIAPFNNENKEVQTMKCRNFLIAAVVVAVACIAMKAFCGNAFGIIVEKPDINEIDPAQLLQVKQAYLDTKTETGYPHHMTADDVRVLEYCGSYNGCIVMMFSDNETFYLDAICVVNVAGVRIQYNDSNELYAWKDGKMYTLEQAYGSGILSKSDIRNIRVIHNQY